MLGISCDPPGVARHTMTQLNLQFPLLSDPQMRVIRQYGMKGKDIAGRNFFVIGPEKQMAAYEAYLKSVEGADTQLYRLYPRDFWLTPK